MIGFYFFAINQDIFQVYYNSIIQHIEKHYIHNALKYTGHITQTKYYDIELVHPIATTKCCFVVVGWTYW